MVFGFQISSNPIPSGVNVTALGMLALVSAVVYYMLRNITTNKFVVIAIGVGLALFTSGYLQAIGEGILALGISRLMEQEIKKIESSS